MIEHSDPPEDVFRAMVENAAMSQEDLADVLCSDEALAHVSILKRLVYLLYKIDPHLTNLLLGWILQEYAELLRRDLEGRLQDNHGP